MPSPSAPFARCGGTLADPPPGTHPPKGRYFATLLADIAETPADRSSENSAQAKFEGRTSARLLDIALYARCIPKVMNFRELRQRELRRIRLPRTPVHKGKRRRAGALGAGRRRRFPRPAAPVDAAVSGGDARYPPPRPTRRPTRGHPTRRPRVFPPPNGPDSRGFVALVRGKKGAGTGEGPGPRWKPRPFAVRVVLSWLPVLRAPLARQAFGGPNAVGRGLASPNPRRPLGP